MQSEWHRVRVGQLGQIVTGKTPATDDTGNFGGAIPFLTPSDFVDGQRRVKAARTLSQQGLSLVKNCLVPRGVAVSCIGWQMGKSVLVDEPTVTNQQINTVVPDDALVDRLFLYYSLSSIRNKIFELGATSTRTPIVNKTTFSSIEIQLPSLSNQRAISSLLGTLDDRLDLLRQTNATLESIAQALFKSWFIDFDPVRAKAEGREPEGMETETAALFPAEFEGSALGGIPKGWTTKGVGEVFSLIMGQSPPGDTYNSEGDGLAFYQGRTDFGFRFPSERIYCTAPTRFASAGATLVSVRAPVGDVNVAVDRCAIGRGLAAVEFECAPAFALYSMKALRNRFVEFEAHGTVFGSINKKQFEALPCIMPSMDVLTKFGRIAGAMDERILVNELHLRSLSKLRDTLLPRLVSGQLRLPEAEAQMSEAIA
ncbi:MAG TPA: restriction endonuclease subunit S [Paraburkholderia sp.]|uniref:restriction endonuclease subunit S n=1 Tax=Paraburkholderia sp. TaxID=1926495 RepID=UPI002ED2186E